MNSEEEKFNFKYVKTSKGEIINASLETNELNEFKESQEYNDMMRIYKEKIYHDYEQNLEISKSEENESSSSFANY